MLKDCLEVFKRELNAKGEKLITDTYVPKDGTYIIVAPTNDAYEIKEIVQIKQDKKAKGIDKSHSYYSYICERDYNSKLVEMNKPIDGKKVIHSNNYLSFFIKKENLASGKLTDEIIDNYYNVLSNPYLKYTKENAKEIYKSLEEDVGQVDISLLENIKTWIKNNIFKLDEEIISGKDYLKIFFDYPIEDYKREGKRYLIPNIYNNNDFNIKIDNTIYGLPNDNMGLNAKKPYLENKTRNEKVPYLINNDEVLLQGKFFDYLLNLASIGKVNIYIKDEIKGYNNGEFPDKDFQGIFLRLKKGKEVEIHDYDVITEFKTLLSKKFHFKNILELDLSSKNVSVENYGFISTVKDMQDIINIVFFSKYLINNYFTEASDMSFNESYIKNNLLLSRETLFNWLYKGIDNGVEAVLNKISLNLIKGSVNNGYLNKACHQFNLRWSLNNYFKGGKDMADIVYNIKNSLREKINSSITDKFENDEEFYFAVGQSVGFLLSKSRGKKKPHSLVNPFINAKDNDVIKANLIKLFKKYSFDESVNSKRFNNMYAMILGYEPEDKVNQDIILAGYLSNNLVYESNKEEKNHE
ncbi:type I-B CRISPR-associated protein Cas8b/Csh1 [Clostridium cibarium]|uniref:Type I-B CRISPR-associated protein Cas8b/Csh1 n=1 Tax=Clostridium cibarium TaxID=2762247 RepID=A0ABR8PVV5_9CLOT|nr:type I-B CRISPR-associated protein Cas8b/Csh1 [Clostridium cibarium]MBD7912304.1 type I-B CRISPR-associated protein Cas8b/Csh1 [Clostridium cibarium]